MKKIKGEEENRYTKELIWNERKEDNGTKKG
jgi:hypothetical protein